MDEALAACERAIALKPEFPVARSNRAMMLLLKGEFAKAWAEYEWRLQRGDIAPPRGLSQPQWKGEDPAGLAILIHAEQGVGDSIHFIRYAPLLAARGARVIVECQPELVALFRTVEGVERVLAAGETLPAFDRHVPMMSLPFAFHTTLDAIPARVPYLRADETRVKAWAERVAREGGRMKVGVAWAGKPSHKDDHLRSLRLSAFAPLAEAKGVSFYSLQKSEAAAQAKDPPPGMALIDLTDEIKDFADTAALLVNLDLVIAVDTAVIHLGGALARPVWTLLHFVPDWRWMLDREDSPWYPTMRLFRQPAPGDWPAVLHRVAEELVRK